MSGKKWNDGTLDKYLKSPAEYAPGKYKVRSENPTIMGMEDQTDKRNKIYKILTLLCYLI